MQETLRIGMDIEKQQSSTPPPYSPCGQPSVAYGHDQPPIVLTQPATTSQPVSTSQPV